MANNIRKLREEMKMTQLRLSIELGISQETVSAYEIGKHYPSVTALLKMADLFHTSVDYILGLSDYRLMEKTDGLPNDEATVLALYRSLCTNQKEKVIAYISGMLE